MSMEVSKLSHRQVNEKMARVVDQFEICETMTCYKRALGEIAISIYPFSEKSSGLKQHIN
jgi:hypothetical protein